MAVRGAPLRVEGGVPLSQSVSALRMTVEGACDVVRGSSQRVITTRRVSDSGSDAAFMTAASATRTSSAPGSRQAGYYELGKPDANEASQNAHSRVSGRWRSSRGAVAA